MENPNRQILRSVILVCFGIAVGAIPGLIQTDQLRREVAIETAEYTKLNDGLRTTILDEKQKYAADHADCQNAILGDGARTILVDMQHPTTIWVVPRTITPHTVDGIPFSVPDGVTLGAAYTHIWPDGRTDGWHAPAKAE